jgi:PKD repeat protein
VTVYTIGSTSPSGVTGTGGTDYIYATKRTLSGAAAGSTWTALRALCAGGSSSTVLKLRLCIYNDLAGSPNVLLDSGEITVPQGSGAAEYTVALSAAAAASNGVYWVGVHLNTTGGPSTFRGPAAAVMAYGPRAYTSGLMSPFNETAADSTWDLRVAADATSPPAAVTPVANFTGTPLTGTYPLSVAFTDSSTNTPTSWAWTFGDGGTSTAQNPSHSYTAAGTYTVALVATNAGGSNTKTRTGYVTVTAPTPTSPPGVSIAFEDNWDTPNPVWTRLDTRAGCRVQSWSIDRGRPNEFAKTGTGTATINIVDLDGLFDPTNATSPYYGEINAGCQAAISLWNPVSNTWHIRFRGFVEAWRYRLGRTREHMELQLDLVDGFAMLAKAELRPGVHGALPPFSTSIFTPDQIDGLNQMVADGNVLYAETEGPVRDRLDAILEDIEWPDEWREHDTDLFSGNVRLSPKAYNGATALDALWDAADGEFVGVANLYCGADGHLKFRGRQARFRPDVAEYNITRYTVGDPWGISSDASPSTVVPISELEWAAEDSQIYNDVTALPERVGSGAAGRPLDPAIDDVPGQRVVESSLSCRLHGRQALTFDNLQTLEGIATGNDSLQETKLVATYYVENYKQGDRPRITRMVFKTRRPGADHGSPLWAFLSNVEISDLLTVKTQHPGGGGFFTDFYVEGIHMTARPGPPEFAIVELSLDVSPAAHYIINPFDADGPPV